MDKGLRGQVVIAFRSNSYCFWEIWAVPGSIPLAGTWFFFFVQINYFKFFMYAFISYNDKKESKLLSSLLKITLNFWTLCFLNIDSYLEWVMPVIRVTSRWRKVRQISSKFRHLTWQRRTEAPSKTLRKTILPTRGTRAITSTIRLHR